MLTMIREFRAFLALRRSTPDRHDGAVAHWSPRSDAGVFVNEASAFAESTANACGTLIARTLATLPAHVLAPRGDGAGNQALDRHPVATLLHRTPNGDMAAFQFREAMLLSAIFNGNGYAEIERDVTGRPVGLWPIGADRVDVCRDPDDGALVYEVNNGTGDKAEIPAGDMFHLKGRTLNGVIGLSLLSYARHALGLAIAQEQYAASLMRNHGAPAAVVKVKKIMSTDAMRRMRAEVDQLYRGPKNAGRVAILDAETDWEAVSVSPQDAEFLAQRRFSVEEICRFFGVPPQLIGDTSKQTFANYEQAGLNFLALAILPWVVRFEQEANRKLFATETGVRPQPFVKLNTAAIVRADLEKRNRAYALGRQWGWLSANDIRRLEDMEPIGEAGDEYLVPMNMQPVPDEPSSADAARAALEYAGVVPGR